MLPWVCSVIDHRRRQNVVRTSVTNSAIASCATFLFLPHFDVICDLLLNRRTAAWNLFVNLITNRIFLYNGFVNSQLFASFQFVVNALSLSNLAASASAQQIPLPTAAPNLLGVSTVTTSQTSTTSVSSSFSGPTVEKITVPDHQPPVAATTAQVKPQPTFTSHKNYLQEYCQKNKVALPVYSSVRENGVFTCTVQVAGKSFTSNGCNTKKGSEQTAASVALKGLGLAQL